MTQRLVAIGDIADQATRRFPRVGMQSLTAARAFAGAMHGHAPISDESETAAFRVLATHLAE
jgi:hypothetical protein